jgi:IclR family transcriptional regulator, KDG regulon repressor
MISESSSVLKRIVAILDCFTTEHTELGVREVARMADLTTSTAGRLMAEMKDIGLLQQSAATRMYSLGVKILAWSGVYLSSLDLRTIALPVMGELRRSTNESITLYVLDGDERLCVERMESYLSVRMVSRVGHRLPLYAGSAGKAILAFLPEERVEQILNTTELRPYTAFTVIDREALRKELKKIRQVGYSESHGEWISDASGVAAPILGQGGEVIGAISISGPGTRFSAQSVTSYAGEVMKAARQLSKLMGFICD